MDPSSGLNRRRFFEELTWQSHYFNTDTWTFWPRRFLQPFNLWSSPYISLPLSTFRKVIYLVTLTQVFAMLCLIIWALFTSTSPLPNVHHCVAFIRLLGTLYLMRYFNSDPSRIDQILHQAFTKINTPRCLFTKVQEYQRNLKLSSTVIKILPVLYIIANCASLVLYMMSGKNNENYHNPILPSRVFALLRAMTSLPVSIVGVGISLLHVSLLGLADQMVNHLGEVLGTLQDVRGGEGRGHSFSTWLLKGEVRKSNRVKETLRYVVQHHQRTTRFIDRINENFLVGAFTEVVSMQLTLCISAYSLASNSETSVVDYITAKSPVFGTQLLILATACWYGSTIKIKSTNLIQKLVSQLPWWQWEESQQLIALVLTWRTKTQLRMTAGPFYTLSMDLFLKLLGVAISYFIFVHEMQRADGDRRVIHKYVIF